MIRRTVLTLAVAASAILAGVACTPRTTSVPGAHTEGGFGSPFYAEVPFVEKEGAKPRIYLFGRIALYNEFVHKMEKPEIATLYIARGKDRATLVVPPLPKGVDAKSDPNYADNLVARYRARHGLVDTVVPEPAMPAAAAAAPAPVAAAPAGPLRTADGLPAGSHVEGTSPATFFAEVVYPVKGSDKPRLLLFGNVEHFDDYVKTKRIPEDAKKTFIAHGKNRETVIVRDLVKDEFKANPGYAQTVMDRYRARHGLAQ